MQGCQAGGLSIQKFMFQGLEIGLAPSKGITIGLSQH